MERMENLINFFEDLDEMVYISDVDTHELIYMNRCLRQSLGYSGKEEYAGKKCYELLQGFSQPCPFCTNCSLKVGKFISWTHKNPVLNKRFLIKDTMFRQDDRLYRVEIAIDIDSEVVCNTPYYFARTESILNECLQLVFASTNPEESLQQMLNYIGKTFQCDRVYVFEFEGNGTADNTYEWCKPGISPQREILQKLPLSALDWWIQLFQENEIVTIQDLEEIRTAHPAAYAILKPQDITRLVAGPIVIGGKVTGFVGVDNPSKEMMALTSSLMKVIGYFIISMLRRRDLLRRLNTMSFIDPLTGAFNRNAMFEQWGNLSDCRSVGVIYCDITGLKQTNDTLGHSAGDHQIRHCYELIRGELGTVSVYRTGGDEFVAVFRDLDRREFERRAEGLRTHMWKAKHHVAVGYAWSDQDPFDLEGLISQADKMMYQDKRNYYSSRHKAPRTQETPQIFTAQHGDSLFYQFLDSTYHDMELLFQSISQQNTASYFYFGDMQKDLFFISDNMRDEFGFQSNVVPGLLKEWAQRIASERSKQLYWRDQKSMLEEKRSIHDLRYQVRTASGKIIWVRCYGIMKWNEDKSKPLFFSGRVSHQDEDFVADPVTNFLREPALLSYLHEIRRSKRPTLAIGFSLNSIADINSTRGRGFSDHLLQNIAEDLVKKLADKMSFFRLEGMRCVAIVNQSCREDKRELVQQICDIVSSWYHIMGISVQHPCSFGVMEYPQPLLTAADFLEQMVSLIRVAKHQVPQKIVEYADVNIERSKRISDMALALSRDVLQGMENFRIVVQPVVCSKDGTVMGGEALLRWTYKGQDVSPAVFVPILEKENMIHLVGRWVFEQAVCTCMRLISYCPQFYLTFNVSLHQMADATLPKFMEETLAKYNMKGSSFVAEMTESCMDEHPEELNRFVEACSKMGIRIALDDFGSGYSSLRMLLQYPSNIIKLDRSLLEEMTESGAKTAFISSIVYACHQFGKKVCMEGVETAQQDELIKAAGCDLIQGFYYYRPMEIDAVYGLLATSARCAEKPAAQQE